jgi:hypothetical protein
MIVFGVRPHESNVQDSKIVVCVHNKSVFVATYVENDVITLQETGVPIAGLDVLGTFPPGLRCLPKPGFKRLLRHSVLFPKFSECSPRDYSHCRTLAWSHYGSKQRKCGYRSISTETLPNFCRKVRVVLSFSSYRERFPFRVRRV